MNTIHRSRLLNVYFDYFCMTMRASNESRVQHLGQDYIVNKTPLPG
jgi:hypothetical protein